jgi:general L-amino acid transport system permease protein
MAETSYVRDTILAPQKAPSSEVGALRWMRENLFSGPLNTFLTLAALYFVYVIVATIGPWLSRSVWNASTLQECRAIVEASFGEGKRGACFAVINERWLQIIFGFYPRDLYWRPTLTMVLMLVALGPVLFTWVPRVLLWFSFAFPAVAFWLLWGGTVWLPIAILLAFGVAYAAYRLLTPVNGLLGIVAAIITQILYWL